jgi:adenylate kinase
MRCPNADKKGVGLRIVIMGAPGAGKGTQAKRIAAARDIPHVSTGDIFRFHLRTQSEMARNVKPFMDSGELVPDDFTCAVVAERLARSDCREGYILDGFPRSAPQAEAFDRLLAETGNRLDVALELEVSEDEIVDRLSARRTCPVCGAIYNLKFDPPPAGDSLCGLKGCQGKLVRRADDDAETVRQRLWIYRTTTEPILQFYRERGLLRTVTGDRLPPNAVFAKFEEILCALEAA